MAAPRAERAYRVSQGWLVGAGLTVTVRLIGKKVNRTARRAARFAGQRARKHSLNRRGVAKPQFIPAYAVSGPSAKALDRLQGWAQDWYTDQAELAAEAA